MDQDKGCFLLIRMPSILVGIFLHFQCLFIDCGIVCIGNSTPIIQSCVLIFWSVFDCCFSKKTKALSDWPTSLCVVPPKKINIVTIQWPVLLGGHTHLSHWPTSLPHLSLSLSRNRSLRKLFLIVEINFDFQNNNNNKKKWKTRGQEPIIVKHYSFSFAQR